MDDYSVYFRELILSVIPADEALVWITAHEAYHYLRRTRQVPGRNAKIGVNRFSDEALEHFRSGWSPS